MMTIEAVLDLLRPEIRALKSYDNLRGETLPDAIILDSNENVMSPTANLTVQHRYRYPSIRPLQLIERLATIYKLKPEQVMLGRGSDDIIDVLIRAFCESRVDSILQTIPCFSMYSITAKIQGAEVVSVDLSKENHFKYDIDEVISQLTTQTKLIFLASPQSPTGNLLALEDLKILLNAAKQQVVVIDEAYIEFSQVPSASELIDSYPNLIVMRTLSKAYGLANLRCGAMLANEQLVKALRPVLTPYALAGLVVDAAYDALQENNLKRIKQFNQGMNLRKEKLVFNLKKQSFVKEIIEGAANFVLCRVTKAEQLVRFLTEENVFVRSYGANSSLAEYIRISVGSHQEIDSLIHTFNKYQAC